MILVHFSWQFKVYFKYLIYDQRGENGSDHHLNVCLPRPGRAVGSLVNLTLGFLGWSYGLFGVFVYSKASSPDHSGLWGPRLNRHRYPNRPHYTHSWEIGKGYKGGEGGRIPTRTLERTPEIATFSPKKES